MLPSRGLKIPEDKAVSRSFRIGLATLGAVALLLAYGFFVQARWATWIWPVPGSYPTSMGSLSHIFISSIFAAIGAPILWIAATNEGRAIAAGAADLGIANMGAAGTALWHFSRTGNVGLFLFALFAAVLAIVLALQFRRWHREPFRNTRPTPLLLRVAFAIFALLLAIVGTALVLDRPNIFPWPIGPENSAIYGFLFLGAMAYFVYGLVYPVWGNAGGQLMGFLAYDLVLIGPFLGHFDQVRPAMHTSLIIYTIVVSVSGLLSIYYLVLHPGTRFSGRNLAQPA